MQEDQQPGQVIIPHTPKDAQNPPATLPETANTSTLPTPAPVAEQPIVQPAMSSTELVMPVQLPTPSPQSPQDPQMNVPATDSGWGFHQEEAIAATQHNVSLPEDISWDAAQFIAHEKSFGWYAILALGGVLAAAAIYILTKDKITTGVVIFALLSFGIFASRKPRNEQYALSSQGVQVGAKVYPFHDFKTFSIADEGDTASIVFMPLKRFMPPLTIYVTSDVEDMVIEYISAYLPLSEHKADAVDNLLRRIRF